MTCKMYLIIIKMLIETIQKTSFLAKVDEEVMWHARKQHKAPLVMEN